MPKETGHRGPPMSAPVVSCAPCRGCLGSPGGTHVMRRRDRWPISMCATESSEDVWAVANGGTRSRNRTPIRIRQSNGDVGVNATRGTGHADRCAMGIRALPRSVPRLPSTFFSPWQYLAYRRPFATVVSLPRIGSTQFYVRRLHCRLGTLSARSRAKFSAESAQYVQTSHRPRPYSAVAHRTR